MNNNSRPFQLTSLRIAAFAFLASIDSGVVAQQEAPASEADEVVVTATRGERALEDVPASVAVRDMDTLRADGFAVGTDEYRGVTGVFFRRGEGDGDEFPFVSFRGSTGTEGSLSLIDGVPIVGLYEETQLNEIPYDAIERVEIVKGPVSALYGRGALYGATNYITRAIRGDETRARVALGSEDSLRGDASVSRKLDGAGVFLSGAYENSEGWREHGARELWNLFGKADFTLSERSKLTAFANHNDRVTELPNGLPLDAGGQVLPVAGGREAFLGYGSPRNDSRNSLLSAKYELRVHDSLEFSITAQARRIDRGVFLNFFDPFGTDLSRNVVGYNGFRGRTSQEVQFLEATTSWTSGRHRLIGGVSGERSQIDEDIRWSGQNGFTPECGFAFFLVEVDVRTHEVLNREHPCLVEDALRTRDGFRNSFWGVFLQDEIDLAERWALTVGGRYDRFRRVATFAPIAEVTAGGILRGEAGAFSPKATLSFRPDWGQVYLAYGRGFNSNFGATFEWDPTQYARPRSRPTTIDSYEFGAKGRAFADRLRFEAAVYITQQRNRRQIIANPAAENDFTAPANLISFGDLYESRGAELSLQLTPRDSTDLTLSYSRIEPEWKDYVLETFSGPVDLSGKTPTGVPRNVLYLAADHRVAEWLTLRASVEAYDDYAYTADNEFADGAYELLTLGARLRPSSWRGTTLTLSLNNALDERYFFFFGTRNRPTYAMPGPPRELRATIEYSF